MDDINWKKYLDEGLKIAAPIAAAAANTEAPGSGPAVILAADLLDKEVVQPYAPGQLDPDEKSAAPSPTKQSRARRFDAPTFGGNVPKGQGSDVDLVIDAGSPRLAPLTDDYGAGEFVTLPDGRRALVALDSQPKQGTPNARTDHEQIAADGQKAMENYLAMMQRRKGNDGLGS